jgi:predicted anti-sigma-YlaC factor YlaD
MNTDRQHATCETYRDDLLRVACGDLPRPPAELAAHLSFCGACRDELETARELLADLRTALEPEALSPAVVGRIAARMEIAVARSRRRFPGWLRVGCTAVAAALLAAVLWPHKLTPSRATESSAVVVELTPQEASELMAAYAVLGWESLTDVAIQELGSRVQSMAQRVERQSTAAEALPWRAEDDWDIPAGPTGASAEPGQRVA